MPKLQTFLSLDNEDRLATLEAMAGLVAAHARVRLVAPRHWRERFGSTAVDTAQAAPATARLATIRRVRLSVVRALRNMPGSPNCLPQALTARDMLQRRGIASQLYIGTERGDDGTHRFHAWLKVGDEWVTGHCDESRYALFAAPDPEPA